jgi:hypothetical protein
VNAWDSLNSLDSLNSPHGGTAGGREMTELVDGALARHWDDAPTALGHALRRLRAERAGFPDRVVAWQSCLVSPPPGESA